jgi:putative Mg2+ transporter-C (MgtC) family protein
MDFETTLLVLGDVAIAMLLGGIIGFERELKNRPAGFRTHMLVAGAAALLVSIGRLMIAEPTIVGAASEVVIDPLRLVEAVIAGVSFIGAGTIFASRGSATVVGITTAASLLMVAIVGVAVAFGFYLLAIGASLLTMVVLTMLNFFEARASRKSV